MTRTYDIGKGEQRMKRKSQLFIGMITVFCLGLSYLFESASAEEEAVWEPAGASFYTNAGVAIDAYNGEVLLATRGETTWGQMGVSLLADGAWEPYGNYPVSFSNGSEPDLYVHGEEKVLVYNNQGKVVVRRHDAAAGQWVQVGADLPVSYTMKTAIATDEADTMYIVYTNNVSEGDRLHVKKLVDDPEEGLQWRDVGDPAFFENRPVYGGQRVYLRVEGGKVYVAYLGYQTPVLYRPHVVMLDEAADGGQWTELEGNAQQLAPDSAYVREMFAFELVQGVPYALIKEFYHAKAMLKRYQDGEWLTVNDDESLKKAYYGQLASYNGMLYLAYSETSRLYEAGDWKVLLKRLDGEEWVTVGGAPAYAPDAEMPKLQDAAFDDIERTWYVAFADGFAGGVMRIADDLQADAAPALTAEAAKAPGESAAITFEDGDGSWRSAVQYVRNGDTLLMEGVHYSLAPGRLTVNGSALHAGLNHIQVIADGYVNAAAVQPVRPESPLALRAAQVGYGYIDLEWEAVPSVDTYRVTYRAAGSESSSSVVSVDGSATGYRMLGLDAEEAYTVTITAVKDGVEGAASNAVAAAPKLVPDGLGKAWQPVGELLQGSYPSVFVQDDELWAVTRGEEGQLHLYRYDGDAWRGYGTDDGGAAIPGTNAGIWSAELGVDGGTPYLAFADRSDDFRLSVIKRDGAEWTKLEGGSLSGPSVNLVSLSLYEGTLYAAYSYTGGGLVVKAYVDDAGSGEPGWIELRRDEDLDVSALKLQVRGGKLYLATAAWVDASEDPVSLYSLDLQDAEAEWKAIPGHRPIRPGAFLDLGFDTDDTGNLYVAADDQVWKYAAGESNWESLGSPSSIMVYSDVAVIDGQLLVAYRDQDRSYVKKYVHGHWVQVGDTVIGHSGSTYNPGLAEWNGQPVLFTHNGIAKSHVATFVYDWAEVVLHGGDGSEPVITAARVGEPLASLESLSRDDYEFLGWFDDQGEPYAFRTTAIEGDMSLYGDWKLVLPTGLAAEAGDRSVRVGWDAIGAATAYKVYVSESDDLSGAQVLETSEPSLLVEGLTNGTTYYIAVQATDGQYESDVTNALAAEPKTVPGVPRNVTAAADHQKITVAFEAPSDDGGRPITSYQIYLDDELKWTGTAFTHTIAGLENRRTYSVTVTAANALGEGDPSAVVEAMPHQLCPVYWYMRDDASSYQESILCGDAVEEPELAERAGYRFEGWYDYFMSGPYEFSKPVTYGAAIEARWSLIPEELPSNTWNVVNDLSPRRIGMSIAANDGAVYMVSGIDNSDFSVNGIVERYQPGSGWSEIGRFEYVTGLVQIAVGGEGIYILLERMDMENFTRYIEVLHWDVVSESWTSLFRAENPGEMVARYELAGDNHEVYVAYRAYDETWSPTAFVLHYTSGAGLRDVSDGLIGAENLSWTGDISFLERDGMLYFAYADEGGKPQVKRRGATDSGWNEVGSLDAYGLVNDIPEIVLGWFDDMLWLAYRDDGGHVKLLAWDGAAWNELAALDDADIRQATLYADDDEGLYALYSRQDASSGEVLLFLARYSEGAWQQIGGPIDPDGVQVMNLQLIIDRMVPYAGYRNHYEEFVLRSYNLEVCTVMVERGNGMPSDRLSVPCGESIDEPSVPLRDGYTFLGWYPSHTAEQAWSFVDPITADMTIVPRWRWNDTGVSLPIGLTADAGDGQVQLRWNGLDFINSYSVYLRTADGAYGEAPHAVVTVPTVTASVYQSVYGLENGTRYAVKIVMEGGQGERAESEEVTFTPFGEQPSGPVDPEEPEEPEEPEDPVDPVDPGGQEELVDPGDPSESMDPGPSEPSSSAIPILVNGRPSPIGSTETERENGRSVTVLRIDEFTLVELLHAENTGLSIEITITDPTDVLRSVLSGTIVKEMEEKSAVIEIRRERASYRLPASLLMVDALLEQFAGDGYDELEYSIDIAGASSEQSKAMREAVEQAGGTVIGDPVSFRIRASYGEETVELDQLSSYAERWIAIPLAIAPNRISTVVVLDPDGTLRHVPTRVETVGGIRYAVVRSFTNSLYTLMHYRSGFSDVAGHWAEADIVDLGSRWIVNGRDGSRFVPDDEVTRAEFAAMAVRAFGLKPTEGKLDFSDADNAGRLGPFIATARKYGLLQGYEDGTIRANEPMTREQALVIAARIVGLINPASASTKLSGASLPFIDADEISDWSLQAVTTLYQGGIVYGDEQGKLSPQAKMSRADAAVILRRMLLGIEWI